MITELMTTEMPGTETPGTEQQCHMVSVSVNERQQSRSIIHLGTKEGGVEKSWPEAESE